MTKEQKAKCYFLKLKSGPKHLHSVAYVIVSNCKNHLASINDIFIFMKKRLLPNERTPSGQSWNNLNRKIKKYLNVTQSIK